MARSSHSPSVGKARRKLPFSSVRTLCQRPLPDFGTKTNSMAAPGWPERMQRAATMRCSDGGPVSIAATESTLPSEVPWPLPGNADGGALMGATAGSRPPRFPGSVRTVSERGRTCGGGGVLCNASIAAAAANNTRPTRNSGERGIGV